MFKQKLKNLKHFLIAYLAYWRYGRPARKLKVIGVTGTKGKSTTSRYIASALEAGGHKVGLLSTVEFQVGKKRWLNDKKMTMLGLGQIQKMLSDMVKEGCEYAVVETSSEGILQYRHIGLLYDIAVFTNLGTEHSERHGGFENLRRDKGKMFAELEKHAKKINGKKVEKTIVVNLDDANADFYLNFKADKKVGFTLKDSKKEGLDNLLSAKILSSLNDGSTFICEDSQIKLGLVGDFNVYNALAGFAVASSEGVKNFEIKQGVESVRKLEGRMEFVEAGQDFKLIVDYAHEPLSLTALFNTMRKMSTGKVIAVIGSDGGGRDIKKREVMGEIAGKLCDFVIVSDVNCYDEDPEQIAQMLAKGARSAGKKDSEDLFVVVDRYEGIKKAISLAKAGDVLAITAKGTEPYIAVANGKKISWDDRKVAKEITEQYYVNQKR